MNSKMNAKTKSSAFWKAALYRAARTALVTLAGFFVAGGGFDSINYVFAISATILAVILSLATSLVKMPEFDQGVIPKPLAVLIRGVQSFAQNVIALIPVGAVVLGDVDWGNTLQVAGVAAIGSFILGLVSILPETEDPAPKEVVAPPAD